MDAELVEVFEQETGVMKTASERSQLAGVPDGPERDFPPHRSQRAGRGQRTGLQEGMKEGVGWWVRCQGRINRTCTHRGMRKSMPVIGSGLGTVKSVVSLYKDCRQRSSTCPEVPQPLHLVLLKTKWCQVRN